MQYLSFATWQRYTVATQQQTAPFFIHLVKWNEFLTISWVQNVELGTRVPFPFIFIFFFRSAKRIIQKQRQFQLLPKKADVEIVWGIYANEIWKQERKLGDTRVCSLGFNKTKCLFARCSHLWTAKDVWKLVQQTFLLLWFCNIYISLSFRLDTVLPLIPLINDWTYDGKIGFYVHVPI